MGLIEKLEKLDFKADYEKVLGVYRNLKLLETTVNENVGINENCVDVYMVTCHTDKPL